MHRDFSPQNILVGTDGISRLTDFGIAKASSRSSSTGAGLIKGKLRYVAPEQARGEELDRRTDIWAAGIIAWELITGQKLVHADDNQSVIIPKVDPPRVRSVDPSISPEMDEAIAGALRVDRTQRTKTAHALARAITAAANKANMLADADEVADHVARLAGPILSERKALLAEARRKRRDSAPDVRAMLEPGASPMRKPLPSLPEIPVSPLPSTPEAPGSELGIEVDLGGGPSDRASEGILGPATSLSPEEDAEPRVYRSPVVAQTPLRRLIDGARDLATPPFTKRKKIIAGAIGAAGLLGIVLIIAAASGGATKSSEAKDATNAASAAPVDSSAAMMPTAVSTAAVPAGGAHVAMANVDHDVPMLHVKANAAIAKVALPDRVIDAVVPAPNVGVDLTEADDGKTLKVVVTSVDGRVAVGTAEPGTREIDVTFGNKVPPTGTGKRTPPKKK